MKIDVEKKNINENYINPKNKRKRQKERFVVPKKSRKEHSVIAKFKLSVPGDAPVALGETEVRKEAFDFPREEIDISVSPFPDGLKVSPVKPNDMKLIAMNYDFGDKTDLVNIVDLNRNDPKQHQVMIKSQLSDELHHS